MDAHYFESETACDRPVSLNGALEFLHILNDGIKTRDARDKRVEAGEYRMDDLEADDI
ncbi:hypothetical protein BROWWM01_81280 [Bradyrhizobium ottawaense]